MSPRAVRQERALDRLRHRAGVTLCVHAALRRAEHGFSEDDVLLTVAAPEQSYPCGGPGHPAGRRMYQRGRCAVVLDERTRVIVTVLPRVADRWEHATAAG